MLGAKMGGILMRRKVGEDLQLLIYLIFDINLY